jgi:glycosyltransferase involved in cell wall biosynthesis
VVVPTYGSPPNLHSILDLPVPEGVTVNYYIVTDGEIDRFPVADGPRTKVIQNKGLGAHGARNTGLEASAGDYILFIDDDVVPSPELLKSYKAAIQRSPDSIGFVGTVDFPNAITSFERGVAASDILTFFGIAQTHLKLTWGVTANLMIKRVALGTTRFAEDFPRHGGGEDIDFCLRIVQRTGKMFDAAPIAVVNHPWWRNGARQYRRFARWAYGDSKLPKLHKQYRYWNFPNMVEAATLGVFASLVISYFEPKFILGIGYSILLAFLVETAGETAKCVRRGNGSLRTGAESALVRLSNEIGRLAGNLRRGNVTGFFERFDYFTTGESIRFERKVAGAKFLLFLVGILILLLV